MNLRFIIIFSAILICAACLTEGQAQDRPNIIFILCDDHRWDAMGNMGHPFLQTPHLDRMVKNGVRFDNAFVTTSLCSPSRASILTGLYAHNHGVVDNYHPVDTTLTFFPQYLQQGGYETAFVGKWHMGDLDEPQRGFDHWVAFRGQGTYYPDGHGTSRVVPQTRYDGFNINGQKRVAQKGYITDELTDYALEWLESRKDQKDPFFLYISHKAVHSDFVPRDEDRDTYKHEHWTPPPTFANTTENREGKPRWLLDQRNSRHGTDYGYNLDNFEVDTYYKRYCESLIAVDDNVGRVLDYLEQEDMLSNTLLVYMGDNGFQFGEHGLIDKRTAYEASIRVPLLMHYPDRLVASSKVSEVVANIDIAATLLDVANVPVEEAMDGQSFWPIARGETIEWRSALLYEYYWEWNYPQTPTVLAVRGDRFKFIRYHGIWDTDELYDVRNDPDEQRNLVRLPEYVKEVEQMKTELFKLLEESNGLKVPLLPDRGRQFFYRNKDQSPEGGFPAWFYKKPTPVKK
ncbi:MAG: sulfatase [Bacteroidota bacterium]